MAEERCTWFEDNKHYIDNVYNNYGIIHDHVCPYSNFLMPGTNRCIFHATNKDSNAFTYSINTILDSQDNICKGYNNNKRIDLYGFTFPDNYNCSKLLTIHNLYYPLCLIYANL